MKSLKQFIAECLEGTTIYEMARSLDDYKRLVESMIVPISVHVLLILKSRQENSDENNEFINHWKHELIIFFGEFMGLQLKTKNNYSARKKHIEKILLDRDEIDINDDWYRGHLWDKLYKEGYNIHNNDTWQEFLPIIHNFQDNHIPKIIDVIASQNIQKIYDYVDSL